jgi:hypothetical protein
MGVHLRQGMGVHLRQGLRAQHLTRVPPFRCRSPPLWGMLAFSGPRICARWPHWTGPPCWRPMPRCNECSHAFPGMRQVRASIQPGPWMSSLAKKVGCILSGLIGVRTDAGGPVGPSSSSTGSSSMLYPPRDKSSLGTLTCRRRCPLGRQCPRAPRVRAGAGSRWYRAPPGSSATPRPHAPPPPAARRPAPARCPWPWW